MGLDFKIRDFAYPFAMFTLKRRFDADQWMNEDALVEYQLRRLTLIIEHAYRNVPYYKRVFDAKGILPGDIKSLEDLKILPFIGKEELRSNFRELTAKNAQKFRPRLLSTSGTSGGAVQFLVDRPSNILEFVYYWRSWGWAGYRLGDTFAELSAQFFTPFTAQQKKFFHCEALTRRVMVNSLLISFENVGEYKEIFRWSRPKFLKGLPSNLYALACIFEKKPDHGVRFMAVFSQGENLLRHQREKIEKVFSTKVFDSYGHMERTVAISQCPLGNYHVHEDYGIAEFVRPERAGLESATAGSSIREVAGTSLYNFAMPLLRYRTGDYVCMDTPPQRCPCNRGFPVIRSIIGRDADVIVTPDGRAITALYVALDRTPHIRFGQIIQERRDQLLVKVAYNVDDARSCDSLLLKNIKDFTGDSLGIEILHVDPDMMEKGDAAKQKVIVSKCSNDFSG